MVRKEQELATNSQNVNTGYYQKKQSKKIFLIIGLSILLISIAGFLFYNATIVTIGKNGINYAYSDLQKLSKAERWIGEVIGNTPKTKKETLYYLIITGIKKEILKENNISILRDNAINTIEENTILKGLYGKIKKYMKEDYYRLVIEPMAIDDIFQAFFRANNPSKKLAEKIHAQALKIGLKAASNQAELEVWEMDIQETEKNRLIISEIKRLNNREKNKVYNKILEFDDNYVIIELKDIIKTGVLVNRTIINKAAEHKFLQDKNKYIDIKFGLLSFFSKNDLQKIDGSIFHE
ncbi:MAG: hypothetical protein JRJ49_06160 [Deltaproteobacteria bacterium]|nr:hypothetical protein [Deltaproteobacteria bacterium]